MRAYLNIAEKAALQAGKMIISNQNNLARIDTLRKNQQDFVSSIDISAERIIIDLIHEYYPSHQIISEESGKLQWGESEYCWVIDPLDGTANYLKGQFAYAVSIALMKDNQIQLGVVYDPIHNELFSAIKGQGATKDQKRIYVSKTKDITDALIATGFPFKQKQYFETHQKLLKNILNQCGDIRRNGSAALDLCWVACGRLDGYFEFGLNLWDLAAGSLIVSEAKGKVDNLIENKDFQQSGNILATNYELYSSLKQSLVF